MVQVAVAAYSGEPGGRRAAEARRFVGELARLCGDAVLFLGGYRGLMRVVVDEALRRGLGVVLVIPREYEGEEFPDGVVVVRTGLGFRERSSMLVRSGDVLASLGGGIGTFFEDLLACSVGVPVVELRLGEEGLLTERLAGCMPGGLVDERLGCRITYVSSGEELAREACRLAGRASGVSRGGEH